MGNKNTGSSEVRPGGRMRVSKHAFVAGIACMAFAILSTLNTKAQTVTVSRTSRVVAGASPTQDSLWTVNRADNSIVKRLHPTIPAETIDAFNALATDPVTGDHYCVMNIDGDPVLGTINIQTGICAYIGILNDNIKSLAFNANGTLFGLTGEAAMIPEMIYYVNRSTAALTMYRAMGNGTDGEVLAYNHENDLFYHWSGTDPNVWERFDTSGSPLEDLLFSPDPESEITGALYEGNGNFITSTNDGSWMLWDTLGNIGSTLITFDGPVRGLVQEIHTSTITSSGPVAICPGSSVDLTVTGGTGGYQWYKDGMLLSETADVLNVTGAGVYNCVYADINGVVDSPSTGIHVTFLESPALGAASSAEVCFGATMGELEFGTEQFFGTMPGVQSYTVPTGVTSINFDIMGAGGGNDTSENSHPGRGGRVTGIITVTPGQELFLTVGSKGNYGNIGGAFGGDNGGGESFGFGGAGGGATDIRMGGTSLADRIVVAGGGAGSGYDTGFGLGTIYGGDGGLMVAQNGGTNSAFSVAGAGSQVAGGNGATYTTGPNGADGALGMGGAGSMEGVSGGGGGGYYGGGGGAWSGGGGGSSFTDPLHVPSSAYTLGLNDDDGFAQITFPVPSTYTYSITWDAPATSAGFTDVGPIAFPTTGSTLPITVPVTAAVGDYYGTVTIDNGICTHSSSFTFTIKPIPTVNVTPDQTPVCNGVMTTDVDFTGPLPFTNYNWTNDLTSIGAGDHGEAGIGAFTAVNMGTDIDTATIIVTPELNGCYGTPDTFTYVVYPTPMLNNNTGNVCDNVAFTYTATSSTAGTTFAWMRSVLPSHLTTPSPTPNIGSSTINETFNNDTATVIPVVYTFTLTANGCENIEDLTVSVNPTPVLYPTPLVGSICDGDVFSYTQTSTTPDVMHSWSRAAITGITPATGAGVGPINETLNNTTTDPILVTYVDTLNINGCTNTQDVQVSVNPTPMLTSSLTPPSVCNNSVFDYNATTATAGTVITWDRPFVPGIASPTASGPDTVNETHSNVTENQIPVVYNFTLVANGCSNTQAVTVIVNPTAHLNTSLTPAAICDSSVFDYEPASNTAGATFAWSRGAVTNITPTTGSGTGNPMERLRNSATFPVVTTYTFTTTIDGCSNPENVSLTVNPRPKLTNSPLTSSICDSANFVFVPNSATLGTHFHWERPFTPGIAALQDTGSGPINHTLVNTTNTNVPVIYTITLSANGCSRDQDVTVNVHPTPRLSSTLTDSACSGQPYVYNPTTNVIPPMTYAWTRAAVGGITPTSSSGTNGINETLVNGTLGNLNVVYVYTLTVGGTCSKTYNLGVKVRPAAAAPSITTKPATTSLCGNSLYVNFGAPTPPAFGNTYTWSATNAEVYAIGADKQYSLVNFNGGAGSATVTLTSTIGTTGCKGVATYVATVGTDSVTSPKVIYTSGVFICLMNDVDGFQWGSDDSTTLDSTMYAGEINQSYFNSTPNWSRNYWVMVNDHGCIKKAYYNRPGDNTPRGVAGTDGAAVMNVFPNPASDKVSVEVTTVIEGTMNVELSNMLGQVISKVNADTRKVNIDVASLPAGVYMIDCYLGGIKIGAAKFVKN